MTSTKHLTPEEEYFARETLAKIKKMAAEKRARLAAQEKEKLKKLHWMHCAKCGSELHEVLFRGINIDKCFECGGVFLDYGELEKLAGHESGLIASILSLFKYNPFKS
ncbi:MAG: zf-TFIIB domain-containing protein [bacterium]